MTPISRPRFSKGKTSSTPGRAESAAVRCAHASITVRARETLSVPKEPSCSGLKHTTSQRPTEVDVRSRPTRRSAARASALEASGAASSGPNDGDRFSNTATS